MTPSHSASPLPNSALAVPCPQTADTTFSGKTSLCPHPAPADFSSCQGLWEHPPSCPAAPHPFQNQHRCLSSLGHTPCGQRRVGSLGQSRTSATTPWAPASTPSSAPARPTLGLRHLSIKAEGVRGNQHHEGPRSECRTFPAPPQGSCPRAFSFWALKPLLEAGGWQT